MEILIHKEGVLTPENTAKTFLTCTEATPRPLWNLHITQETLHGNQERKLQHPGR